MKRALPLLLAVSLLSACQAPTDPLPPELSEPVNPRLQARASDHTLASLGKLNAASARALQSLAGTRYEENGAAVDLAEATYRLEVADLEPGAEETLKDVVFADYVTAIAVAKAAGIDHTLPSVNLIDGLCKQINDDVYARLELLLEADRKADLRRRLLVAFQQDFAGNLADPHRRALVVRIAASLKLAGEPPELTGSFKTDVEQLIGAFNQDPLRSKPIGLYTQNEALQRIFQSDRMLQTKVPLDRNGQPDDEGLREAALAAKVLSQDAELKQAYDGVALFYQRMTNPFSAFSPTMVADQVPAGETLEGLTRSAPARAQWLGAFKAASGAGLGLAYALLPPSRSSEAILAEGDPAAESDLMGELIRRVRDGRISLAPQADSGFYQYQQHALSALLTPEKNPESRKISYGDRYLKRLEEAFKTGLAKARETHAKQLDVPVQATSVRPEPLKPRLYVEPIATVYLRYAQMYDFLERQVLPLFPAARLAELEPLRPGASASVTDEVARAKRLMSGLYLVTAASLGIAEPEAVPLAAGEAAQAIDEAKAWLADLSADDRLAADTRVAVPVKVSEPQPGKRVIHFWGTGGVTLTKVRVSFDRAPRGETEPADYFVTADKFVTFTRPYEAGTLSREEYRRILDTSATWNEALRRLEGK